MGLHWNNLANTTELRASAMWPYVTLGLLWALAINWIVTAVDANLETVQKIALVISIVGQKRGHSVWYPQLQSVCTNCMIFDKLQRRFVLSTSVHISVNIITQSGATWWKITRFPLTKKQIRLSYGLFASWLQSNSTNKSSAVAQMGDRSHNRDGPKIKWGLCPFFSEEGVSWVPI